MTHVLVTAPFPDHLLDKLRAVSPKLTIEQMVLPDGKWPEKKTTKAVVYYALSKHLPPLHLAPHLRWIQTHWAGVDSLLDQPIWQSDVQITSSSGIHAPNMAQYTLTQILAWAHRVPQWFKHQQKGTWPRNRWQNFVPEELNGRVLGILGYGSIGREIARLIKPFGMKILVTKRDARRTHDHGYTPPGTGDPDGTLPDRIYPTEATRSMLAQCDYVVVTLPYTPQTHHFINQDRLKAMKSTAYLINIGRGAVVDEKALIKALKKGWIAGAGLDVFEEEPLPDKSPLWSMENVILTPHTSGFTPYYDDRVTDLFAQNLRLYLAGKPLLNLVNRENNY